MEADVSSCLGAADRPSLKLIGCGTARMADGVVNQSTIAQYLEMGVGNRYKATGGMVNSEFDHIIAEPAVRTEVGWGMVSDEIVGVFH